MAYSEEELTERLADHFEKGVRHALTRQQVRSKSTLFQILTDYDNDDKRAQNRKPNRHQNKREIKSDERNEKYSQNRNQGQSQNVNESQQRKPWQTRNINATQIQNKNKTPRRNTETHTPLVSNKDEQKSHDDIDILGIQVEATISTPKSEN